MGKKKKPNKSQAAPAGNTFAALDASELVSEDFELEEGSAAWLQEQKRLLDQYQGFSEHNISQGGSASSSGSNVHLLGDSKNDSVIERQRRMLEEASRGAASNSPRVVGAAGSEVFAVRRVPFCSRQVPVLLQNRNGPCPLLAVANSLLLRGTLRLPDQEQCITSADLVSRLARLCESLNAKSIQEDPNAQKAIQDLVELLPRFLDGLDVNVRFSGCAEFEYTEHLALFDCFNLELFHVWVDPKVAEVATGWNALAEHLAVSAEIRGDLEKERRAATPDECEKLAEAIWLEEWLEETRSQVTPLGCQGLMDAVKDRELCVLFRNNHFTTVFKPRSNVLCTLLTDASFESLASAVWESVELDGSTGNILDAQFTPSAGSNASGANADNGSKQSETRSKLLQIVQEMGFSRKQAEAGLGAVNWSSAEEAVDALLEADGELPLPASPGTGGAAEGFSTKRPCPSCGKVFKSFNGLLNHRAAKGH